jgi:hypothetical protein
MQRCSPKSPPAGRKDAADACAGEAEEKYGEGEEDESAKLTATLVTKAFGKTFVR